MSKNNGSNGVTTIGLLGVLFVGLKLGGIIDWPWIWVTVPFWGQIGLLAFIFVSVISYHILREVVKYLANKSWR